MKIQMGSEEPILRITNADMVVCAHRVNTCVQVPARSEASGDSLYQYLDLDHLLDVFSKRVMARVPIDGLTYRNTDLDLCITKKNAGEKSERTSSDHLLEYRIEDRDTCLGTIEFFRQRQFLSAEVRRVSEFVDTLIGPLRNASLYSRACQSAYRDALTGVQNRAALDATLSQESSVGGVTSPLVLMVCDVDRFKAINDNCGHVVGDEVLRQFASALQANTRESDLVYRYGGDEFVIALGNTQLEGGREFAERIRYSIQKTTLYVANACINLTTTIGLTELRLGESLDEAFLRADDALLAGKREGKNRVVCH